MRFGADCTYLKPNDKKAPGYCKCTKIKKHVLANTEACDKFDRAYARRSYDCEKLYDEAKETSNKSTSNTEPGTMLVFAILLIILLGILKLFHVA